MEDRQDDTKQCKVAADSNENAASDECDQKKSLIEVSPPSPSSTATHDTDESSLNAASTSSCNESKNEGQTISASVKKQNNDDEEESSKNSKSDILDDYSFTEQEKKQLHEILTYTPMYNLLESNIQINYRNKLGQGSFCSVYPVHLKNPMTNKIPSGVPDLFAIKKLNLDITKNKDKDPLKFQMAHEDLYQEAMMMMQLQHSNIITMFGMSDAHKESKEKFFVIIERLSSTLDLRLNMWGNELKGAFPPFTQQQVTPPNMILKRLKDVVSGVAHGIQYFHSQNVLYRDLKPANIGFDVEGNVKIFDFGLAIRLPNKDAKMKGKAGTIRYMAPEMKSGQVYDSTVDVYSLGILTWQILTTRLPFEKEIPPIDIFGDNEEDDNFLPEHVRPDLQYIEDDDLLSLLRNCWDEDPKKRWNLDKIVVELERIIKAMEEEAEEDSQHQYSCCFHNQYSRPPPLVVGAAPQSSWYN